MNAPFCPISRSQPVVNPRGLPTNLPAIPIATDLESLIRAINAILDILRSLTFNLTVNNTFLPRESSLPIKNFLMSIYPEWRQGISDITQGFVYRNNTDPTQRAFVSRTNAVAFREPNVNTPFDWRYVRPLSSMLGSGNGIAPFEEDFFERVVNVHWGSPSKDGLAVEFGPGASPAQEYVEDKIKVPGALV